MCVCVCVRACFHMPVSLDSPPPGWCLRGHSWWCPYQPASSPARPGRVQGCRPPLSGVAGSRWPPCPGPAPAAPQACDAEPVPPGRARLHMWKEITGYTALGMEGNIPHVRIQPGELASLVVYHLQYFTWNDKMHHLKDIPGPLSSLPSPVSSLRDESLSWNTRR